jgi:O-antigen/teichoic acid export membrane protein
MATQQLTTGVPRNIIARAAHEGRYMTAIPVAAPPPVLRDSAGTAGAPATSLSRNFGWTLVGNVIHAACGWAVFIVLAKIGSPEIVGMYALGVAISLPVAMFAGMNLRAVLATDTKGEHPFGVYLVLRLTLSLFVPAMALGACLSARYASLTTAVVMAVTMGQVFDSISDIYWGLLQRAEQMSRIALSMIARALLSLVILTALLTITGSIFWAVAGYSVARGIVLVFYDTRSTRYLLAGGAAFTADKTFGPVWNIHMGMDLLRLALPLGVVLLFVNLVGNIPRYFIERELGARPLGIYAALFSLFNIGNTLTNALGQAAIPRLGRLFAEGRVRNFSLLLLKLMGLGGLLGVAGVAIVAVCGRQIVAVIYRPEYGAYTRELLGLMCMATIAYVGQFAGVGLTAARYFKGQIFWNAAVVIAGTVACYRLVPTYRLNGAVMSMTVSMAVHLVIGCALLLYVIRRQAARYASLQSAFSL